MHNRTRDPTVESTSTEQQISVVEQLEEPEVSERELSESTVQDEVKGKRTTIFFRIWFGLNERELLRLVIGAVAAAFSGISKPVFGFFIIKIGVAYYDPQAKQEVGRYSLAFSLVGLFSLFTHTLQHYFFGVVGEKAMTNLRRTLYTGIHY